MIPDSLFSNTLLASLVLSLATTGLFAEPAPPSTRPAPAGPNGWDVSLFNYKKPAALTVEESTPAPALVDWQHQPPKLPAKTKPPVAATAGPLAVQSLNITHLRFRDL